MHRRKGEEGGKAEREGGREGVEGGWRERERERERQRQREERGHHVVTP